MNPEKNSLLEVRVRGNDLVLWREKRGKFIEMIGKAVEALMEKIIDPINKTTVKEEAQQLISLALNHVKARSGKPGIENEKTIAEIQEVYAKIEEISINNRKNLAVAEAQEFKNFLNRLEFSLGSTKIMLSSEKDDESIIFTKQISDWMELVRSIKNHYL